MIYLELTEIRQKDTLVSNNNGMMECYDSTGTAC